MKKQKAQKRRRRAQPEAYAHLLRGVMSLVEEARLGTVRSINAVLTSTYWLIGRRIVEHEQSGSRRAGYGDALIDRLAQDLTGVLGRGFSVRNIRQMRQFYLLWRNLPAELRESTPLLIESGPTTKSTPAKIRQTASANLAWGGIRQTVSANLTSSRNKRLAQIEAPIFPLPWSHYVRLLSVDDHDARHYYEREALLGGWSVRQLDRQIATLAYQRTRGARSRVAKEEILSAEAHLRDPFILEFLDLKDEYSESDLEDALTRGLETFLLELGSDFAFVARQKRLRIGNQWFRIDLLFFHRRLKCLVVIDLKLGAFTHEDAGQMNLYLNYARENWTHADENPPVGLILWSEKNSAIAHYSLGNLENKVLAREYHLVLPTVKQLTARVQKDRRLLLPKSGSVA